MTTLSISCKDVATRETQQVLRHLLVASFNAVAPGAPIAWEMQRRGTYDCIVAEVDAEFNPDQLDQEIQKEWQIVKEMGYVEGNADLRLYRDKYHSTTDIQRASRKERIIVPATDARCYVLQVPQEAFLSSGQFEEIKPAR